MVNPIKIVYVSTDYFTVDDFMIHLDKSKYKSVCDIEGNEYMGFVYTDHTTKKHIKKYIYDSVKSEITNHIMLKTEFTDKHVLHEYVKNRSKKLYDKYFMKQYMIDKRFKILKKLEQNKMYIVKPIPGFSGIGIKVFKGTSGIKKYIINYDKKHKSKNKWVIQRYINEPLLYNGKKFHMRVMILVYKESVHFYRDFIVFPAKEKFTNDDLRVDIHDTHGTLTESHEKCMFPRDVKNEWNTSKIHTDIVNLLNWLKKIKTFSNVCYENNKECFEFYGMDIMVDKNQNIKCLEINHKPGLKNMLKRMPYLIQGMLDIVIKGKYIGKGYCKI